MEKVATICISSISKVCKCAANFLSQNCKLIVN